MATFMIQQIIRVDLINANNYFLKFDKLARLILYSHSNLILIIAYGFWDIFITLTR